MSDDSMSSDDVSRNRGQTLDDLVDEEDGQQPQSSNELEQEDLKRFTFDMPPDLHRELKHQALIVEDRPMRDVANEAIRAYLDDQS